MIATGWGPARVRGQACSEAIAEDRVIGYADAQVGWYAKVFVNTASPEILMSSGPCEQQE